MNDVITAVIKDVYGLDEPVHVSVPDEKFGDLTTNAALILAPKLEKPPREIAETLAETLKAQPSISDVSVAGAGFINLRLTDAALLTDLAVVKPALDTKPQTVVIETNCPNPFKAMHIGHAFNAVIGDTLANLLELSGDKVHRVSYHGDVGLHVGKSMYSLLRYVDGDITRLTAMSGSEQNSFMSRMYAEGAKAYKEDEAAKAEIDELTKESFTLDDPLYKQVYEICKQWSYAQIDDIVTRLGNKPIEKRYQESEADRAGVPIVKAHVPDVFKESDGALVFEGSQYGSFDNAFVTSRGLGLYGARDLGLMTLKNQDFNPDKSYIVTAEEQRDYFKGVIAAAELCLPELKDVTVNISTGTVKLMTGKMSSRDGDVVEIAWLFDRIAEAVKARGGQATDDIVAGALRYQFLKVKIGSDVIFDVGQAVSLSGNSGSYLQYAHARAHSILKKADREGSLEHAELDENERSLVRKLTHFADVLKQTERELAPHLLCTYLYELAQAFNRFYEKARIIGDEREVVRLALVRHYADTLARGLTVLGIRPPEQM